MGDSHTIGGWMRLARFETSFRDVHVRNNEKGSRRGSISMEPLSCSLFGFLNARKIDQRTLSVDLGPIPIVASNGSYCQRRRSANGQGISFQCFLQVALSLIEVFLGGAFARDRAGDRLRPCQCRHVCNMQMNALHTNAVIAKA